MLLLKYRVFFNTPIPLTENIVLSRISLQAVYFHTVLIIIDVRLDIENQATAFLRAISRSSSWCLDALET